MKRVGVLGGGQLAMMLGEASKSLNVEVVVLSPDMKCPAASTTTIIQGDSVSSSDVQRFAQEVDVVSFEFENIALEALSDQTIKFMPSLSILSIAQDRQLEKAFFKQHGLSCAPYHIVQSQEELVAAVNQLGVPCIIKTCRMGYDGKGQVRVRSMSDTDNLFETLGCVPLIVEAWVSFSRELSLIAVRDQQGHKVFYPLSENKHDQGILRQSFPIDEPEIQRLAEQQVSAILDAVHYVGVLTVEFFDKEGELLVNEMAPRVHNTGHWTIEGAKTSQFENHLRAITGLPLGDTSVIGYPLMINCISAMPDTTGISDLSSVYVHDYHKAPRPQRKLGHITLVADDMNEAQYLLQSLVEHHVIEMQ